METDPAPVELGEIFVVWTRVEEVSTGQPVSGGEFVFDATMPDHGHGLFTLPKTRSFNNGRFHTIGAKLHMFGRWVFELEFHSGGSRERVTLEAPFEPKLPR